MRGEQTPARLPPALGLSAPTLPLGARTPAPHVPPGVQPPDLQVRSLAPTSLEQVTPLLAHAMGLSTPALVLRQRQLTLVGQIPYHCTDSACPQDVLDTIPQAARQPLLWLLFHRETGAAPPQLCETITFRLPQPQERTLLHLRASSLLLDLQRWLHLADGRLFLYTHLCANPALHTFTADTGSLSWPELLARLAPAL
jgi:DNA-binding GntR family transcriptional regulator